jgi:hypothetical protein
VHEFVATFDASLQTDLGAIDPEGPGQEGDTGDIGCSLHWRSCHAQPYIPVTQAFQAFDTGPRLYPEA